MNMENYPLVWGNKISDTGPYERGWLIGHWFFGGLEKWRVWDELWVNISHTAVIISTTDWNNLNKTFFNNKKSIKFFFQKEFVNFEHFTRFFTVSMVGGGGDNIYHGLALVLNGSDQISNKYFPSFFIFLLIIVTNILIKIRIFLNYCKILGHIYIH